MKRAVQYPIRPYGIVPHIVFSTAFSLVRKWIQHHIVQYAAKKVQILQNANFKTPHICVSDQEKKLPPPSASEHQSRFYTTSRDLKLMHLCNNNMVYQSEEKY
mmetsp:Transcript_22518/g.45708  ORF Transcript_22518/g.45708 Transcript_22518/m.45708 type:complete len:103 (-) Transcript_22518:53-361(-)